MPGTQPARDPHLSRKGATKARSWATSPSLPTSSSAQEAPRSIGRGPPRQIPAILLAKLALNRSLQGRGLGAELLVLALSKIVDAARAAGGKLVVVDAIDEAAAPFAWPSRLSG
jgi:hypothetical protein